MIACSRARSRFWSSSVGNSFGYADGSSTSCANSTARHAASGRRAHHRCRVEGWPCRIDFSRTDARLMASRGRDTSISFRRLAAVTGRSPGGQGRVGPGRSLQVEASASSLAWRFRSSRSAAARAGRTKAAERGSEVPRKRFRRKSSRRRIVSPIRLRQHVPHRTIRKRLRVLRRWTSRRAPRVHLSEPPAVFRPARPGARVPCSDDRRRMSPVSPRRRSDVGRVFPTFANETPPPGAASRNSPRSAVK